MKPDALLRSLKRLASKRGWVVSISEGGNHTKVIVNGKRTVIGRHPQDLKPGTLHAIIKQLGLRPDDLKE